MSNNIAFSTSVFVLSASVIRGLQLLNSKSHAINMDKADVTVSAPGKVLIAGGYLVLEEPNIGVTVATTSRFYTSIRLINIVQIAHSNDESMLTISVSSPQFHSEYVYSLDIATNALSDVRVNNNTFVERCLKLTFSFLRIHLGEEVFKAAVTSDAAFGVLSIKLRADNDFYSQITELRRRNLPLLSASLYKLEKFISCPMDEAGRVAVAKTGLGSSAALTTSLVGALLQWFGVVRLGMRIAEEDRRVIHNLAQLVHANAQGKIGSGFDVAAAVYGTQTYKRFSPATFSVCLEEHVAPALLHAAVMAPNGSAGWNQLIAPFQLPAGLVLVLGDVCGGSPSASMAKEVLRWKKERAAEAEVVWGALADCNGRIAKSFERLKVLQAVDPFEYSHSIQWASNHSHADWAAKTDNKVVVLLVELRQLFKAARVQLKRMGEGAGVDIEPAAQTRLADATESVRGVLCALVPGAGGVDALVALALSDAVRLDVEHMWAQWSGATGEAAVCPLMLKAEAGSLSGVVAHSNIAWD